MQCTFSGAPRFFVAAGLHYSFINLVFFELKLMYHKEIRAKKADEALLSTLNKEARKRNHLYNIQSSYD